MIWLIQRADPNEAQHGAAAGVVAPQSDATRRAAGDPLTLAAVRGCSDDLGRRIQVQHAVGLDQRIQSKVGPGLTLTPSAMTAMHEERSCLHAVADQATVAAPIQREHLVMSAHRPAPLL